MRLPEIDCVSFSTKTKTKEPFSTKNQETRRQRIHIFEMMGEKTKKTCQTKISSTNSSRE